MKIHRWKYWGSGEAIEFGVRYRESMMEIPKTTIKCRGVVKMDIGVEGMPDYIFPLYCLACKRSQVERQRHYQLQGQALGSADSEEETYYRLQERAVVSALRARYAIIGKISDADASKITETLTEILRMANITHRCPEYEPGLGYYTLHWFEIKIKPLGSSSRHGPPPEADLYVDDVCCVVGEVDPLGKPATTASVLGLLKVGMAADDAATQSCGGRCQCPICMEDMDTTTRNRPLRMPCSHRFHAACLLHWLNKSPSCPLCRYAMPAARYQAHLYPW